jgi:pimeloyl-ACP methyl ester carboxylesterase
MFAQLPEDPDERRARDGQRSESLAASLREAGTGTQRWLGDVLGELSLPVLALAGSNDERFVREALAIAASTGGVASAVPGAGHAAHLHQPAWTARVVEEFLEALVDQPDRDGQHGSDD